MNEITLPSSSASSVVVDLGSGSCRAWWEAAARAVKSAAKVLQTCSLRRSTCTHHVGSLSSGVPIKRLHLFGVAGLVAANAVSELRSVLKTAKAMGEAFDQGSVRIKKDFRQRLRCG